MYSDVQLKQALAKMLPANLIVWYRNPQFSSQAALRYCDNGAEVLDTELLHLCWLVEETLQNFDIEINYAKALYTSCEMGEPMEEHSRSWSPNWLMAHATWQQRTIALCKVKGVEIV